MVLPEVTAGYFRENFKSHEGKLGTVLMLAAFLRPQQVGSVADHAKRIVGESRVTQKQKKAACTWTTGRARSCFLAGSGALSNYLTGSAAQALRSEWPSAASGLPPRARILGRR
jgi:hypothetical protein